MILFYSLFFKETSDKRKDMADYRLKGKRVTVHRDGEIFVDGSKTNIKQWASSSTRYSNLSGQEQKDLKGLTLEEALVLRGFLPRR